MSPVFVEFAGKQKEPEPVLCWCYVMLIMGIQYDSIFKKCLLVMSFFFFLSIAKPKHSSGCRKINWLVRLNCDVKEGPCDTSLFIIMFDDDDGVMLIHGFEKSVS